MTIVIGMVMVGRGGVFGCVVTIILLVRLSKKIIEKIVAFYKFSLENLIY